MSNAVRQLLTRAAALGVLVALTACEGGLLGGFAGGYDKVAYRERDPLPRAAAPDPPPYVPLAGGAAGASGPTLDPATAPPGVTQEMVTAGQQSFGTICTACHGANGVGTPAGPSLNDGQWINISGSYDEIVGIIQNGVPAPQQFPAPMPPMGGGNFTPDQVRELAAYVYALSHSAQ